MKKLFYIILLAIFLILDAVIISTSSNSTMWIIYAFIIAEIAIYSTCIIFEIIKSIRQRTYCGHTRQHKETDQFIFYHSISLFSPQSISEDKIFINYQYFRSFSSRKMFLKRLKEKISLFYRF